MSRYADYLANATYGHLPRRLPEAPAQANRTELTNDEVVAIYANHQDAIDAIWVEDEDNTLRFAVEEWLARQFLTGSNVIETL
jgi:hypothetical protein